MRREVCVIVVLVGVLCTAHEEHVFQVVAQALQVLWVAEAADTNRHRRRRLWVWRRTCWEKLGRAFRLSTPLQPFLLLGKPGPKWQTNDWRQPLWLDSQFISRA
jgi:hypothetical protein